MVRIRYVPCGVIALKTWSVVGSDIWRSYGIFRRHSPARGRSLWSDFETLILSLYLQFSLYPSCMWIKMKFASFLLCCHAMASLPSQIVVPLCFLLHIAFSGIYFITATKNRCTTNLFLNLLGGQILGLSVDANNWEIHLSLPRNESQKKSSQLTNSFSRWLHKRGIKSESRQGRGLQKIQNCFLVKSRSPMTTLAKKSYFSRCAFWVLFIPLQVWQWRLLLEERFVFTLHGSLKYLQIIMLTTALIKWSEKVKFLRKFAGWSLGKLSRTIFFR